MGCMAAEPTVDWIAVVVGDYGTNRPMSKWLVALTVDVAVGNIPIVDPSEENILFDHRNVEKFRVTIQWTCLVLDHRKLVYNFSDLSTG